MISFLTSSLGFNILLLFFFVGAVGSLVFQKSDKIANVWGNVFAIAGSLWGIGLSFLLLTVSSELTYQLGTSIFPLFSISFHIDKLSAFFVFVISLITLFCSVYGVGYVKHYYQKYNIGALGFFYNLFIAGMLMVVTASNELFFLVAWEIMSVASFFLVIYDRHDESNVKAGFLYLVMTHIGTAFIILAFILFYKFTGSFDFENIKLEVGLIPLSIKNIIFILAMIGFGTKAGVIPFHIWLPSAHPAAPSHVSGLMSGVMIKTGIYMMIRLFLDILQPVPSWWGLTLLIVGAVSSLLGVLYALTEHDIKRLLAYHSIENIGIILLGLGSALTFTSLNMPALAILGLVAALFHTLNHATFKSLLFFGAGSVINATHTRNIEEYGGLIKFMPYTAMFFLVGSMAISALPPFNGFFSEWLTFQSLFQGIIALDFSAKWIFMVSAGALAFTGGLALACFVKAFGATFLARPRSEEVKHAKESSLTLRFGMGMLALCSLLFGVFSGYISSILLGIGNSLKVLSSVSSVLKTSTDQGISVGSFSFVSAPILLLLLLIVFMVVLLSVKYLVYRKQDISSGATWDCGVDLNSRMEITATGFSRSIITIFRGVLKPSLQHEVEYHDEKSRYLPKFRGVTLSINDMYRSHLYEPMQKFIETLSEKLKKIQSGNVNAYILYIFIALIITLIVAN
ncbi:MAG: hydrogenase 4 subunit B [Candidatus Magasanikiibacteriota bacterium]